MSLGPIRHGHSCSRLSDEFVVVPERFRLRLMGSTLELSYEGAGVSSPESAETVADRYAGALRKFLPSPLTLVTEQEFLERTAPPFGGMFRTPSRDREYDPRRTWSALRAARNECLGQSADPSLRRCYDHLQNAREQTNTPTGTPGHEAYKATEVLVARFGSEPAAVAALGATVKKAKRVANQPRHIPENVGAPVVGDPLALATEAVRAYERYLLDQAA